jgi:proline iminopeptidase
LLPTHPPSQSESYLAVPGAQLYCREIGTGTPLFILHGGPDFNHNYLLPEMDLLASAFRLIYYDQRGRGKSSSGVAVEDVTIESDVGDLDRLRQHFGLETISLLGHSWGCILAMEYATRHPDRIGRLILMNSAPASHADLLHFRAHRQVVEADSLSRMQAIAATQSYLEGDIQTEAQYYRAHFSAALRRGEDVEKVVARLRSHFTPGDIIKARAIEKRLYEQTWYSPEYDLLEKLRRCKLPALVIHGAQDLCPVVCARHIADALPGARLVVLDDCGHFAYLERPMPVFKAIKAFIK